MKLLICDDDISTIGVLKHNLDLKKYEIDEVLEAYNGKMAIDIIKQEDPELILCDIGMPLIKGTEVLKFARENNEQTEFAFLTCYDDFKYAQLGIQYRASGYIVKPFKLGEVEELLSAMTAKVRKNKKAAVEENQSKKDLVVSTVFKQITDGYFGTDPELIRRCLENNEIQFGVNSTWRAVFSCFSILDTINSAWSKELLLYASPRVHDELLNQYIGSAHSIVNYDDRFMWCITFVPSEVELSEIDAGCHRLNEFYQEHFNIKPVALVSEVFELHQALPVVTELYATIRRIRYYGGKVFHQADEINKQDSKSTLNEEHLLWCLRNRDEAGYEAYISNILMESSREKAYDKFKKELTMFFLTAITDNNIPVSVIYDNEKIQSLNKQISNKNTMMEYAKELMNIYQTRIGDLNDSEDVIVKAKKFMDDNYRDNIDRDDVAKIALVTPNYLSKLFRRSVGMNLREYINQLRIEESKRLLLSTNMTVSEIAIYVGYYNISYFSTVFHKLVGMSPSDYRTEEETR